MFRLYHTARKSLSDHRRKICAGPNGIGRALGRFVYGQSYLKNPEAVPIDPIELKLSNTTYSTVHLKGVFGALRDAGPDYWGRRVIEKHAGKSALGEMDYLLDSPDDRAGALGFGLNSVPPAPLDSISYEASIPLRGSNPTRASTFQMYGRLAIPAGQLADGLDAHALPLQFFQFVHVSPP
jgi:hypothetical protein